MKYLLLLVLLGPAYLWGQQTGKKAKMTRAELRARRIKESRAHEKIAKGQFFGKHVKRGTTFGQLKKIYAAMVAKKSGVQKTGIKPHRGVKARKEAPGRKASQGQSH